MKVWPQVKNHNVLLILILQPDYREKLEVELKELRESELWQAGKTVRSLRPENQVQQLLPKVTSSTKEVFRQQTEKTTFSRINKYMADVVPGQIRFTGH